MEPLAFQFISCAEFHSNLSPVAVIEIIFIPRKQKSQKGVYFIVLILEKNICLVKKFDN